MSIRKILAVALRFVGREDLAADIDDGGEPYGEGGEAVKTLMYCINAVEDELARYYFPLECTEELSSEDNFFPFSSFSHTPVRILSVTCGGKRAEHTLTQTGVSAVAPKITVTYHYAPSENTVDGESAFGGLGDGMITALGAAAEYCLICGEASLAEVWETRYREAIDRAHSRIGRSPCVPPRRWI